MKTAKLGATVALLLFVGATVGMLIAQEVSQPRTEINKSDGTLGAAAEGIATAPAPSSSEPTPEASAGDDADPGTEAAEGERPVSIVQVVADPPCVVDAIYFHNTFRCATCLKIERDAKTAMEAAFPYPFESGRLRWSVVNMEAQRQVVEQYDLVKPTLILARSVGDEPRDWIALDDTWTLIRYEARFSMYIEDSVRAFLEGCP